MFTRAEPGHGLQQNNTKKCSALHNAECIRDDKESEDTQEEDSTHDEDDQDSSSSFDDDEDSTASQEDDLEDWIIYMKRCTKETDDKMLTCSITNRVETPEMETSPADRHPQSRQLDQKSR